MPTAGEARQASGPGAASPTKFALRSDIASPRIPQELLNMIYEHILHDSRLKPAPGATVESICTLGHGFLFVSKTQSAIFQTLLYKRARVCCHDQITIVRLSRSQSRLDRIEHLSVLPPRMVQRGNDRSWTRKACVTLWKLLFGALPGIRSLETKMSIPDSYDGRSPVLKSWKDFFESSLVERMNPIGASEDHTTALAPHVDLRYLVGHVTRGTNAYLRTTNSPGEILVDFTVRCSAMAIRGPVSLPELFERLGKYDDSLTKFNLYTRHKVLAWAVTSQRGQLNIAFDGHISDLDTKWPRPLAPGHDPIDSYGPSYLEAFVMLFQRVFLRSPDDQEYLNLIVACSQRFRNRKRYTTIFEPGLQSWLYGMLCMMKSVTPKATPSQIQHLTIQESVRFFRFLYQYADDPPLAQDWQLGLDQLLNTSPPSDLPDVLDVFFAELFQKPPRLGVHGLPG